MPTSRTHRLATSHVFALLAIVLACVLLGPRSAPGQVTSGPVTVDIDFPGGPVAAYMDLLEAAASERGIDWPLNIVLVDKARDFNLPPIKIRTNLDAAVQVLASCSSQYERLDVVRDREANVQFIRLRNSNPVITEVLNVRSILEDMPHEDFSSAIAIGMEFAGGDSDEIDMKLHDETGLLFVKGPENKIMLVQRIINQLQPRGTGGFGRARGSSGGGPGPGSPDENANSQDPFANPLDPAGRGGNRRRAGDGRGK